MYVVGKFVVCKIYNRYTFYINCSKCPPFSCTRISALFLACHAIFRTRFSLMSDKLSSTITFKDEIVLDYLFFILTITKFQTLKSNGNKSGEQGGQFRSVFLKIIRSSKISLRKSR